MEGDPIGPITSFGLIPWWVPRFRLDRSNAVAIRSCAVATDRRRSIPVALAVEPSTDPPSLVGARSR